VTEERRSTAHLIQQHRLQSKSCALAFDLALGLALPFTTHPYVAPDDMELLLLQLAPHYMCNK
jgi:hypothetical protein